MSITLDICASTYFLFITIEPMTFNSQLLSKNYLITQIWAQLQCEFQTHHNNAGLSWLLYGANWLDLARIFRLAWLDITCHDYKKHCICQIFQKCHKYVCTCILCQVSPVGTVSTVVPEKLDRLSRFKNPIDQNLGVCYR